jgi:hypothetical protein
MKVAIESFAEKNGASNKFALSELRRLREFQSIDRYKVHSLVQDVDTADIVIFVGSQTATMLDFRRSDAWRHYPDKCFVYYGGDRSIPLLPGIYVSLERRFHRPSWTRSASYLRVAENANIEPSPFDSCDLLYSFAGAISNHPTRKRLLGLSHNRGLVIDRSELPMHQRQRDGLRDPKDPYITSYVSLLRRSKFVLCPRGIGVSSWRLFETLKAARVPVVISDQWVPPDGPDWGQFSIRVPEADIESIPVVLARREEDAPDLARAAKAAWDEWFAADVVFHRIVEWCLAIKRDRRLPAKLQSRLNYLQLARPFFFRHWLLADLKRLALSK